MHSRLSARSHNGTASVSEYFLCRGSRMESESFEDLELTCSILNRLDFSRKRKNEERLYVIMSK